MALLHLITDIPEPPANDHIVNLVLALHREGLQQIIAMPDDPHIRRQLQDVGLQTIRWHRRLPKFMQRLAVKSIIARYKITTVQGWGNAAIASIPSGINAIGWTAQAPDLRHNQETMRWVTDTPARAAQRVDHITTHYIPRLIGISSAPPLARHVVTTPARAKILVAIAPLHPRQKLETLIDALPSLPDCYLWIAGKGSLQPQLEQRAEKIAVLNRMRFITQRYDPAALIRAADLVVIPAYAGRHADIIPQAWAAGTPVIALRTATTSGLIDDGINGLLIPPDDAEAITSTIRRGLDDGALRRVLCTQGFACHLQHYSREAIVRAWLALYDQPVRH